ncbi:DUF389 domain-containing protein [Pontibacter diazotrophicus]|uniref:DUF389 domain-containing protein n=1 Tax=Pontibacter diazotrophicus TaxID=1400979 RepID=A0A3D8LAU1_9BACT|nr:DUF389 domain-containing protein [Pontibacter diazotrophicus]RDV14500.1 DUF389 domain-containing protein [Pontibacter diazotrophicus]
MPRKVEITVSPERTENILTEINELDGLINLQVLRGASVNPQGDVILATIVTSALQDLERRLDRHDLGKKPGLSLSTSEPDSLVNYNFSDQLDRDSVEASWEEMEMIISKDSNATSILLLLVVCSGILAAVGIATNAMHVAIAGMLVAPGFMPIMRITLGLVSKSGAICKRGVIDVFLIYLVLIAVAAFTAFLMQLYGMNPLADSADYYEVTDTLFTYWTTVSTTSVAASVAASLAGAVLIATKRSVFTSGVMIGLALVPSAAIVGMALVAGDTTAAGLALLRWLIDVGIIVLVSFIFFICLKSLKIKRNIAM